MRSKLKIDPSKLNEALLGAEEDDLRRKYIEVRCCLVTSFLCVCVCIKSANGQTQRTAGARQRPCSCRLGPPDDQAQDFHLGAQHCQGRLAGASFPIQRTVPLSLRPGSAVARSPAMFGQTHPHGTVSLHIRFHPQALTPLPSHLPTPTAVAQRVRRRRNRRAAHCLRGPLRQQHAADPL